LRYQEKHKEINPVALMVFFLGGVIGLFMSIQWLGGPKVKDHWEDLGVGGRITLNWTLGR
jgi:hypothetical protein